jgi:hypothetical protein
MISGLLFLLLNYSVVIYAENGLQLLSHKSDSFVQQDKGAMLYINRPDIYSGSLSKLNVSVNGVSIVSLKNNSTFIYHISNPGNITIRVTAGSVSKFITKPDEIYIQAENDKSYFVEVGWTNNIAKPVYIKQVSYEQVTGRFPDLAKSDNQVNAPTENQVNNKSFLQSVQDNQVLPKSNNKPLNETKNSNTVLKPAIISDVDINIPVNNWKKPYSFALIIGNEDYSSFQTGLGSEVNVAYAENDARIIKEYAIKTLGIQEENIILIINSRAVEMSRAITKMNLFAKNSNGKAEIIVYYAGHGFPEENTHEPYLMPVDVNSSDLQFAVKLNDLYRKMTEYPVQKVTIFLDACFSGGGRDEGLVAARGVKIKPKETSLSGNLAVFTSSSGDQSSLSYKDKAHGMFTYFLLKKLQETKGRASYKELADYISEQVSLNSIRINNREQNPQTNISPEAQNVWETWNFSK